VIFVALGFLGQLIDSWPGVLVSKRADGLVLSTLINIAAWCRQYEGYQLPFLLALQNRASTPAPATGQWQALSLSSISGPADVGCSTGKSRMPGGDTPPKAAQPPTLAELGISGSPHARASPARWRGLRAGWLSTPPSPSDSPASPLARSVAGPATAKANPRQEAVQRVLRVGLIVRPSGFDALGGRHWVVAATTIRIKVLVFLLVCDLSYDRNWPITAIS
jgi:hypothetical protein